MLKSTSIFSDVSLVPGITNHEEYSLVRELSEEDRMKTLTMKRDRSIAKDQKKLEEMKKKLHTDDECMSLTNSTSVLLLINAFRFLS